jgi:Rrf2 family protein
MLRFNQMTDYAVLLLRFMVQQQGHALSAQQLANGTSIARPSVSNIMKKLVISGICKSTQGSAGGYSLALPAVQISLWQVIQAMDGVTVISRCLDQGEACAHEATCELKPQWQQLNGLFQGILDSIDFEQLKMPLLQHPLLQAMSSSLASYQSETLDHG